MIERTTDFDAGNTYSRRPVVELRLADHAARMMLPPGAAERLIAALPPMREEVLDFPALRRLATAEGPVPAAAVVELFAVTMQRYMNWPLRFCSWRPGNSGRRAVFEAGTPRVGKIAGRLSVETVEAFLGDGVSDPHSYFRSKLAELAKKVAHETPSMDAMIIARAAAARGIPWSTVPRSTYLRLGWGRHAHVLLGSETTKTSSIGRGIARRKELTTALLAAAGVPVATQRMVRRLEDAQAAARAIGFPIVVKPANGNMGKGVSIGVADAAGIVAAFERAQVVSRNVLVEALVPGEEYRLLVVGGRFIAATRRRPAKVRGDGISTLRELVEQENARPERESILPGRMAARLPILLDAEACALVAEQGLAENDVPDADVIVLLRRESNVSRGGDSVDETDRIHPSVRAVAERAATALGIDVCGIDFISSDIARPWWEAGAAICEVNTRPGLILHARVSEGRRRDVAADVVDMLYPDGAQSRIPVVAVIENGETSGLVDALAAAAAAASLNLGVVRKSVAAKISEERVETVAAVPWNGRLDMALIAIPADVVERRGLGLERIDLAILPRSGAGSSASRAGVSLARVARGQVAVADARETLNKALEALGLPRPDQHGARGAEAAMPTELRGPARVRADGFSVLMVGDIGFGESYLDHPRAASLRALLEAHGRGHCFAHLRGLLASTDMVIGNLEAPLSRQVDTSLADHKKYLSWSDPEASGLALREAGIHAVCLANNHMLDCGTAGLVETVGRLDARGIANFGAGGDLANAERPLIVPFTVDGVERSLVVFAGFEHRRRYERRFRWYARPGALGVCELSPVRIATAIAGLRDRLPSPTFVAYPHWGTDYTDVADTQRSYAAALVDAGVDLVIGHGAHVAQTIETIEGCPVIYGLGNFVWNTPGRFEKLKVKGFGLAAALEFGADGPRRLRLYPLLTDNGITGFQTRPVAAAEFVEAARGMAPRLEPKPRRETDAVGHHLEIDLTLARQCSEHAEGSEPVPAASRNDTIATMKTRADVLEPLR